MGDKLAFLGFFNDSALERTYLQDQWQKERGFTLSAYLFCCFFMIFAGVFGDYQREFFSGSAHQLMALRVLLFVLGLLTFIRFRKVEERPHNIELYFDSMKLLASTIIVLLTIWTKGRSLTLMPGIMMTLGSYFILLNGRWRATLVSAAMLFSTFAFFSDAEATFGLQVHKYMAFMLLTVIFLLSFFKLKAERFGRINHYQENSLLDLTKTKDHLLLTIAHDIRGPLQLISARSQKLLIKKEEDPQKFLDVSTYNISQIQKVSNLLNELVSWAIDQEANKGPSKEACCIAESVTRATSFVEVYAKDKEITVINNVGPQSIPHDQKIITTCLRNLIINALKFSPRGSQVTIELEELDKEYILQVRDKGPGLSPDLISKIEGGNNHSSQKGSEGEAGSSLGLRLVKNLLDKHQSGLKIKSSEEGATFMISLPKSA